MPTVKYDVSDVESGSAEVIKAGMYEAAITEASYGKSSNDNNMFTLVLTITSGDYKGRKLWHYILPDQAEFRMREFTDSLELPPKGSVNTDKIIGTVVGVRTVVQKSDDYGEQARVKNLLPADTSSGGDEDEEAPYTEWDQSELADEVTARELTIAGRKTKAKMVAALEADDEAHADDEEGESEEEEADAGDDDTLTYEDLTVMSRADLKTLIKEEELEVKVLKKDSDDDLREKIAEALELEADEEGAEEEEEEEGEEPDPDAEPVDYTTWEIAALKDELKERGLKPDGRKSILAARLKKDDESGEDPF